MKRHITWELLIFLVVILAGVFDVHTDMHRLSVFQNNPERCETLPDGDWLFRQRAYPDGRIDTKAYATALTFRAEQLSRLTAERDPLSGDSSWHFAGPTNIGGRITDIEHTTNGSDILYVAGASGGIFKSVNDGDTWIPLFDDEENLSIGDMALAPSNEQIIYVGTGEANAGGGSVCYDGNGVYRSDDGGDSWTHLGLEHIGGVGRVLVDPDDPDRCFVAAMGYVFQNSPDRGLYRTTDGGLSWKQVLFVNDSTGVIDLVMHPQHPDTLFAAAWQRVKRVDRLTYGGDASGIYRSYDGGDTWQQLTNRLPGSAGRIGLAVTPADPDRVMAYITNETDGSLTGLFKSMDAGDTWTPVSTLGIQQGSFMWWFGRLFIDPTDPDIIYVTSVDMFRTTNGGQSWDQIFRCAHVDQHCLWIDPDHPSTVYLGNDGGLYKSIDRGDNCDKVNGLPINQFYTCEMDYTDPSQLYGGTQDNGTLRTVTGSTGDWERISGGDGFRTLVDPADNRYVYAEFQYGGMVRSENNGSSFAYAVLGIPGSDRHNWNTPYVLNPNDPSVLYYGTNRLYRSDNRAYSWMAISPDLTRNPVQQNVQYGTITAISVSPLDDQVIYVGTDDGLVQMTSDGGMTWTQVSASLPNRWVTSVTTDPEDVQAAYVTFSGFRYGSYIGHIYKTLDGGSTWADITGNLPDIPVNDLVLLSPERVLCIATDIGVYQSSDEGMVWTISGDGIPNLVITDLSWHDGEKSLVATTYGRGLYRLDIVETSGTRDVSPKQSAAMAYPNPFAESVTLQFDAGTAGEYVLSVYDVQGVRVLQVHTEFLTRGMQSVELSGAGLKPGIYVCVINEKGHPHGQVISIVRQTN